MARKRLGWIGWTITILYLTSFALPVGGGLPGIAYFALGLIAALQLPGFFLIRAANPLLWVGLSYLRRGRWDRVMTLGLLACLSAYLPLVPYPGSSMLHSPDGLLGMSGYFAWVTSMALLAAAGVTGWATEGFSRWPRPRLKTLMISIAVIALLLALLRILPWLMAMLMPRPSGFYMG
jgi:hypothetical protein